MRIFALAIAALPLLGAGEARAWGHEPYPWCANSYAGPGGGGINCGYDTLAQCRAAIAGVGGTCQPNQMYPGPKAKKKGGAANAQPATVRDISGGLFGSNGVLFGNQ